MRSTMKLGSQTSSFARSRSIHDFEADASLVAPLNATLLNS